MTYQYRAGASKDGSINPNKLTGCPVRNTLREAIQDGNIFMRENRVVTVARADCDGINAGKFFLHFIMK